jgi:phage tail sheath protein FI
MKFNNYLEFLNFIGSDHINDNGCQNVRAYFECGGGPCYIVEHTLLKTYVPQYEDITLIVQSGTGDEAFTDADIPTLCPPGSGKFAILDGPNGNTRETTLPVLTNTPYGAVYYPSLSVSWAPNHWVAPSAVAAAFYCVVDRTRGVWKAPANIRLPAVYQPRWKITDEFQGQYTGGPGKAYNMIRTFDGGGPVIWGARTLEDSDEWRYVSVRRFFNSAEQDIKAAMQSLMFEPNNQPTWEKARGAITNYLRSLWEQGALVGSTETEAYFVRIGLGVTMTADDVAQGKWIAEVGMAAVRPAEFIILQFTQNMQ